MLEKLTKLVDVKTIVTFSIVGTVIFLAVTGKLEPNKVYEMAMIVITFFFVKKADQPK